MSSDAQTTVPSVSSVFWIQVGLKRVCNDVTTVSANLVHVNLSDHTVEKGGASLIEGVLEGINVERGVLTVAVEVILSVIKDAFVHSVLGSYHSFLLAVSS